MRTESGGQIPGESSAARGDAPSPAEGVDAAEGRGEQYWGRAG
jgi:hypothetical protein